MALSVSTVVEAYERLVAEGLIEAFPRQQFADQRQLAFFRHGDIAAARKPGDQQETTADKRVFGLLGREAVRIEGAGNQLVDSNAARSRTAAEMQQLRNKI